MANKPDIWMPLYIAEYQSDTNRLTTMQHGAYLLLIMDYWRNGELPNDKAILLQITRLPDDAWEMLQALLKHYFKLSSSNTWTHARIEKELSKAAKNQAVASEKASKAARTRWNNASSNAPSIHQAMPEQCPSPSPLPIRKELKESPRKYSDDDMSIAELIFSKVQEIDAKAKRPNLESWANEVRLMRERDNRSRDDILDIFIFANTHSFWRTNILSPSKLREKFTTLLAQKTRPINEVNQQDNRSRAKRVSDKLDEIAIRSIAENGFTDRVD